MTPIRFLIAQAMIIGMVVVVTGCQQVPRIVEWGNRSVDSWIYCVDRFGNYNKVQNPHCPDGSDEISESVYRAFWAKKEASIPDNVEEIALIQRKQEEQRLEVEKHLSRLKTEDENNKTKFADIKPLSKTETNPRPPVKSSIRPQPRIALVIGNGAYSGISRLRNPPNDARLMAHTLRRLKFDVIEEVNTGQKTMKRAMSRFSKKLKNAGNNAVGLFFYAGHGVQVDGRNYLIPVDAKVETEADLDIEAIDANAVMRSMEYGNASLNFAILDACRNNPYARGFRSVSRGLARMEAPRGTLIAYATRPGDIAVDGDGVNSPYTAALTKALLKPGLTVSDVFIEVRNEVMRQTGEKQVPWEEGGLTSRFYFAGKVQTQTAMPTQPVQSEVSDAAIAWQSVQNSTNPAEIEQFILAFKSSPFAGMARAKLKALKQRQQAALVTPAPESKQKSKPQLDGNQKQPLLVIRFDKPNVSYEQALYHSVAQVLEGVPNASFDLIAVAPDSGGSAKVASNFKKSKQFAENIQHSLEKMGLPPSRVSIFMKTSSSAITNEVHLFQH